MHPLQTQEPILPHAEALKKFNEQYFKRVMFEAEGDAEKARELAGYRTIYAFHRKLHQCGISSKDFIFLRLTSARVIAKKLLAFRGARLEVQDQLEA